MKSYFPSRLSLPVTQRDHVRGNVNARVTLVEYGDFECPYCGRANPILDEIRREMGDALRLVFRNFPLTEVHPHAEDAAEIAEAAGDHHKFWEMHDMLYAHQHALEDQDLAEYASLLWVAESLVKRALTEHAYLKRIHEDFMSGVRSGVNGTLTLFVNGARCDGALDRDSLSSAVQNALRTTSPT